MNLEHLKNSKSWHGDIAHKTTQNPANIRSHQNSLNLKTYPSGEQQTAPNSSKRWPAKLHTLVNAYDQFRYDYNNLLEESPNMIRAVQGLYPGYAQYENEPLSGWTHNPPISLDQQNALSVPDKIAFGAPINNEPASITLTKEKSAQKLADLHQKDGGNRQNRFEKHKTNFNKDLLVQLKNYTYFDQLASQKDDVSQLAYTRLKALFDSLELILDEDALQKHTGISMNMAKEKKHFVTDRLLPDPTTDKNKITGTTLWSKDDKTLKDTIKKRPQYKYVKNLSLPLSTAKSDDITAFIQPAHEIDHAGHALLNARKQQLNLYAEKLPDKQKNAVADFIHEMTVPLNGDIIHEMNTAEILPKIYQPVNTQVLRNFHNSTEASATAQFKSKAKTVLTDIDMKDRFENYKYIQNL